MGGPKDHWVSGRIPAGDPHVIAGKSLGELDIEDAVRIDERQFPDLVNPDR
jgi:hypothetical protein